MPAWLKLVLKTVSKIFLPKINFFGIFKWIRDFFKGKKFNKKVDKATKEMKDAETKDEFTDAFNNTP